MIKVIAQYKDRCILETATCTALIKLVENCFLLTKIKVYKKEIYEQHVSFWVNAFYIYELTAKYLWKDEHEYLCVDIADEIELHIMRLQ